MQKSCSRADLVGDGAEGLSHAHHQLAQLGVGGGLHQELSQAVADLNARTHSASTTKAASGNPEPK